MAYEKLATGETDGGVRHTSNSPRYPAAPR